MKRTIIILLMLNIFIFLGFQIYAAKAPEGHQSLPELHADKLQILSDEALAALPGTASSVTPSDAVENAGASK